MISLNPTLYKALGLIYWELKDTNANHSKQSSMGESEYDLLTKILLAKGINLNSEILTIKEEGVVEVKTRSYQLVFDDVSKQDSAQIVHLAHLSDMLKNQQDKKKTWQKLKPIDL